MKVLLATLGSLAAMGAAAYAGIVLMWVGGVEEAVRGFQASPVSGSEAAWGLVKALVFGDLIFGAGIVVVFLIWTAVIASD